MKGTTVYAIGHSTRKIQEFIEILRAHDVDNLVDIRTIPKSRHNPQFNGSDLALSLCSTGIGYIHLKELGGLRRPAKDSKNTGWRNASFRGFADYMQTEGFEAGLEKLGRLAKEKRIAMMCAEGSPFRCHRSLVADALTVRGGKVIHIASRGEGRPHRLTPFARVKGTALSYPTGAAEPRTGSKGWADPRWAAVSDRGGRPQTSLGQPITEAVGTRVADACPEAKRTRNRCPGPSTT